MTENDKMKRKEELIREIYAELKELESKEEEKERSIHT